MYRKLGLENTEYPADSNLFYLTPTYTKSTFTGTLVNVGDLRRNSQTDERQGRSRERGAVGSPKFAKLHQTSPKF